MRFRLLAGTVFSSLAFSVLGVASAQEGPAPQPPKDDTDKVTVTATRQERAVDEVPATVTVIDDKKIENDLATDIKDLVRFEPGVSVRNSPTRFGAALGTTGRDGNSGFNIRGLEGNRVLIQTDGVRIPDGYTFGAQAQGRGDYVDLDLVKSVEILRGPASALYGSDGVAGAVSFVTRDPDDIVVDGRTFGARARAGWSSADDSISTSVIGATEVGDWSAMVAYSRRDAREQDNKGVVDLPDARRTRPNPLDATTDSVLAKLVWAPIENNRFRFTFDRTERNIVAEVLSGRTAPPASGPPATTSVIDLDAEDRTWRERYTFDHIIEFGEGFFDKAQWAIYLQQAKTRQFTDEDRLSAADRIRDTTFDNSIYGGNAQIDGSFETGPATHNWILGGDYSVTRQTSIRNGTVPPAGEVFPQRPFPNTDYTVTGIFLGDEISFLNGMLLIFPALRYDAFELDPERDALYPPALPATPAEDNHVSPKLGVVVWPVDWLGGFANYAAGYKAPTASQINSSFANPIQNYTSIANPDLRPESSDSVEAGVRVRNIDFFGAELSGSVTAFSADFEDFIEQVLVSGSLTPSDPGVFQHINLTGASIHGWESKLQANWDSGLSFTLTTSSTDGDSIIPGALPQRQPLQSTDPFKLVAGLGFNDPGGLYGWQAVMTRAENKRPEDVSATGATTLFLPPQFMIFDLTGYWNVTDWAALRLGIFNATDEQYWWWSDVRGLGAASAVRDAYTQPGRNFSASLTLKY
jgi:hemoglobin/transferrin/lactoferrin receptor protein